VTAPQHPRAQLAQWGLRPKKRFGQNFLMDGKAAHRIARLCISEDESPGTRVLEIGGGTGALTQALLEAGARARRYRRRARR
jgi:16S rRNA (adenine1518-N6/adenine1519-N6)-dimethyltransferase